MNKTMPDGADVSPNNPPVAGKPGRREKMAKCKACQGEGVEWNNRRNIPPLTERTKCRKCNGTGIEPRPPEMTEEKISTMCPNCRQQFFSCNACGKQIASIQEFHVVYKGHEKKFNDVFQTRPASQGEPCREILLQIKQILDKWNDGRDTFWMDEQIENLLKNHVCKQPDPEAVNSYTILIEFLKQYTVHNLSLEPSDRGETFVRIKKYADTLAKAAGIKIDGGNDER